jgi:hypothetical protein
MAAAGPEQEYARLEGGAMGTAEMRVARQALTTLAVAIGAALLSPAAAGAAAPNCFYDQLPNHVLFVGGDPELGVHLGVQGGEIVVTHLVTGPDETVGCTGTPTTANTDTISVTLDTPGESTQLQIANPPAFAPGFTDEPFGNPDEIEVQVNLGDQAGDHLHLVVGAGTFALGDTGVDSNPDTFFLDQEIALTGVENYRVVSTVGETTVTGQGNSVTGGPSGRPLTYVGGSGRDRATGGEAVDGIDGGSGRDVLRGAGGGDFVTGGPGGRDKLFGEAGADHLFAKDGKRDKRIDCGPGGSESAKRDKGKDPQPKSC